MPVSDYDGVDGLQPRNDLAGLNLTTVPKVLIETGNMRNATDAAMLVTPAFQQAAAAAMAQAITIYLTGHAARGLTKATRSAASLRSQAGRQPCP